MSGYFFITEFDHNMRLLYTHRLASHQAEKWSGQTNWKYITGPAKLYCSIGFVLGQWKVVRPWPDQPDRVLRL